MAITPSECRVALICGGTSGEREISLASGEGAREALEQAGFPVTKLDPSHKEDLKRLMDERFDVAFLTLHGKMGEDGTIQGFLEMIGLPYTCSGVIGSALAMDKARAKTLYAEAGIPTAPSVSLRRGEAVDIGSIAQTIGIPCVVKPATEGSALGVEIVGSTSDLSAAIDRTFNIDDQIVIERYIAGTEITVAILGNEETKPLPVIEIVPQGEFYDFESKYAPGGSKHICPAPLPAEVAERAQDYAARAHRALGCLGVSRSDFIIDADGVPWILETNTIPGMTATSLLPDAARAAGLSFPELCTALIEYALER